MTKNNKSMMNLVQHLNRIPDSAGVDTKNNVDDGVEVVVRKVNDQAEITNKDEFKQYVREIMKEAHGEDYDEAKADKMAEDIAAKVEAGDIEWAEAVGMVQSSTGDSANDDTEVIVRQPISDKYGKGKKKKKANDEDDEDMEEEDESEDEDGDENEDETMDSIHILSIEGNVTVGDAVMSGNDAAADGIYAFNDGDAEVPIQVVGGVVVATGDAVKTVVRGGQKKKIKVPVVKKRLSAAQKAGLRKAQRKAQTSGAKKERAKSMKVRQRLGLSNSADSGIDAGALGDSLYEATKKFLVDKYDLQDEHTAFLDAEIREKEGFFDVTIADGTATFAIPVWVELNDEIDLEAYDSQDVEVALSEDITDADEIADMVFSGIKDAKVAGISDSMII